MTCVWSTYWSLRVMCGEGSYVTPLGRTSMMYTFIFTLSDTDSLFFAMSECVCSACLFASRHSLREIEAGVASSQMRWKWISRTREAGMTWCQLCLTLWILMSFQHVFSSHFKRMVKLHYPNLCVCVFVVTLSVSQVQFPIREVPFFPPRLSPVVIMKPCIYQPCTSGDSPVFQGDWQSVKGSGLYQL